jgi:hypothetical protein
LRAIVPSDEALGSPTILLVHSPPPHSLSYLE